MISISSILMELMSIKDVEQFWWGNTGTLVALLTNDRWSDFRQIIRFSIEMLRSAKLMVASWFVKLIWNLIFTVVRVNHSINPHPRSYFALIILIQLNAIRKLYEFNIFAICIFLDSMVKNLILQGHPDSHIDIRLAWRITMERR